MTCIPQGPSFLTAVELGLEVIGTVVVAIGLVMFLSAALDDVRFACRQIRKRYRRARAQRVSHG